MTRDELILAMRTSLTDGDWPPEWAEEVAVDNVCIASVFPVGTVIERRLDEFRPRHSRAA